MKIKKECLYCGKEFYVYRSLQKTKYCSMECYQKSNDCKIKKDFIPWNKGTTGLVKAWNKGKKLNKEERRKISEARKGIPNLSKGKKRPHCSGEKHWNWIKDRTKLKKKQERNDSAYKEWRRKVLERDNYKCVICGEKYTKEYKLVVHHILPWRDYPEERYNINNGITLCQAHHPRVIEDEKRLIPTFNKLVGSYEQ
jgi:5-methylcytosine-specific restriction endonuclease McrA